MTDPMSVLRALRRPRLLIRAAHLGLPDYRRDHALPRLVPEGAADSCSDVFSTLAAEEASMNEARRSGGAAYSPSRHVELLAAMIFEARLFGPRAV
jgi:hypothetical protein